MIGARVGIYSGKNNFIGLLDELNTTPQLAFSVRRLTATSWTTGNPLVRVRRSSDNEEANFSYDNTNVLSGNSISFSSSSGTTNGQSFTTWAGADTIYVTKWFNQIIGGNDAFNIIPSSQPILDSSFDLLGNNVRNLYLTANITGVTDYMNFAVDYANLSAIWLIPIGSSNPSDITNYITYYTLVNRVYNNFNGTNVFTTGVNSALNNAWIIMSTYRNTSVSSTNNIWNMNGYSYTVSNPNTWASVGNILHTRGGLATSQEPNRNKFKEEIFFNSYNSSDYNTIRSNQSSFYGISI